MSGGPGMWTLYTLLPPTGFGMHAEPSIRHFAKREEALAAQAAWKQQHADYPDALASVTPWQPESGAKSEARRVKPKRRR